ncbi:MAG: glycosyltransferase [Candidatus Eisenbacteria bacterium]|nr:glycosyltransferase [Candidatus Eisenbacteria bacterium]
MALHVLYVAQYYNEPQEPGGGRHYAFTRSLVERGHRVTLITGQENYRTGRIPRRYGGRMIHREELNGVEILRAWVMTGYRRRFWLRYLNQLSFLLTGTGAGLRLPSPPEVVVASSPPLLAAAAGALLAARHRAPLITDIRDLWPESVIAMGLPVHAFLVRGGFTMARWIYRRSRALIAVTQGIRDGLMAQEQPSGKIHHIPNGVDWGLYEEPPQPGDWRSRLRLEDKFVSVYVGGMGPVHNVATLVEAAAHLARDPRMHFVLAGDGPEKPRLARRAQELGLTNVTFHEAVPKREVPGLLAAGDLCVYSLRNDPFFRGTFPNKNFDYMASGRPLVLAVEGESQQLVEAAGAGRVVPPEDAGAMAAAIREMAALPAGERRAMGERGRRYVMERYHRRQLGVRFAELVEAAAEGAAGR